MCVADAFTDLQHVCPRDVAVDALKLVFHDATRNVGGGGARVRVLMVLDSTQPSRFLRSFPLSFVGHSFISPAIDFSCSFFKFLRGTARRSRWRWQRSSSQCRPRRNW